MKKLLFFISIIIILIIIEFIRLNTKKNCPKPIIEYRYIPRTFEEEQDEPVFIDEIFNSMFAQSSPWMISKGISVGDRRDTSLKNKSYNPSPIN